MTHLGPRQPPQTTGHIWDGDVQEFNNPIPRWWLWAFYIALACALLVWLSASGGWWDATLQSSDPVGTGLQTGDTYPAPIDPRTTSNSQPVFGAGADSPDVSASHQRNTTAANLTSTLLASAPPTLPTISWAKEHRHYLQAVADTDYDAIIAVPGMRAFANAVGRGLYGDHCAACHGPGGSGISGLYPSLTDDVWLRGKSFQAIRAAIGEGHQDIVPGFAQRFSAAEIKLLTVFVHQVGTETGTIEYQTSRIKTGM